MLDFCRRMKMVVTNTLFKKEKRRRYTWIRPGDSGRYQLDYILVRQRFRNSVKNAKSYPGADVYSDHNLVMMNVEVKLKKVKKGQRRKRWLLEGIEGKVDAFQKEIGKELTKNQNDQEQSGTNSWIDFKEAVGRSAENTIGFRRAKRTKKPWITQEMVTKMDERRQ